MHPETLRKNVRRDEADSGARPELPTSQEREEIRSSGFGSPRHRQRVPHLGAGQEVLGILQLGPSLLTLLSMHRPAIAVSVLLAAAAALALPAHGQARTVFVESPSGNIACQPDSRWGALCMVFSDRRQAEVRQNGRVSAFDQESDPPSEGVRVLGYGKSLRVRRVRCSFTRTGMRYVADPPGTATWPHADASAPSEPPGRCAAALVPR